MVSPEDISSASLALGRQFASCRKAMGLSQGKMAPLLGYSRSTVANVETGRQRVNRSFWERADRAVNANGVLLAGFDQVKALVQQRWREIARVQQAERVTRFPQAVKLPTPVPETATLDAVNRRPVPDARSALPVEAVPDGPTEPWARLAHALSHPDRLDEPAVEHLEHRTGEFFRREDLGHTASLATDIQAHISRIQRLLDGGSDRYRRRLLVILGEAYALAGWIAWNNMDTTRADHAYQQAEQTAWETGDPALLACVLVYRSHLTETLGQLSTSHRLLIEAQRHATDPHHATTRSWVAAREAEVAAALNKRTAARHALERAAVAYDYAQPHHERPWTTSLTPGLLAATTITTYTRLDSPQLEAIAPAALAA